MDKLFKARQILNPNHVNVVCYHSNCPDGFGSAYIAWKYFASKDINEIEFIPLRYEHENFDRIINNFKGKNVLMVDVSFDEEKTKALIQNCKTYLLLDHHKSAMETLHFENCIFDMNRSGVGLTWSYFFANEPLPLFLEYVQDRDLWAFKHKETKAFTTFLYSLQMSYHQWDQFLNEDIMKEAIEQGTIMQEMISESVQKEIESSRYKMLGDWKVRALNSRNHISEVGHAMSQDSYVKFSCVFYYDLDKDYFKISLRSDGKKDVSEIAREYGGGGHANSAGFIWKGHIGDLLKPCKF